MSESRLTRHQAAVIGAFTGIACGPFCDVHQYVEQKLGRPVLTNEFADPKLWEDIREAVSGDFMALCYKEEPDDKPAV